MNERVMQFRIGMFVIVAGLVLTMLIVWFGESPSLFRDQVYVKVHYAEAPGVAEGIPVRKSGIRIGEVVGDRLRRPAQPARRRARDPRPRAQVQDQARARSRGSRGSLIGDVDDRHAARDRRRADLRDGDAPPPSADHRGGGRRRPLQGARRRDRGVREGGRHPQVDRRGGQRPRRRSPRTPRTSTNSSPPGPTTGKDLSAAVEGIDRFIKANEDDFRPDASRTSARCPQKLNDTLDPETQDSLQDGDRQVLLGLGPARRRPRRPRPADQGPRRPGRTTPPTTDFGQTVRRLNRIAADFELLTGALRTPERHASTPTARSRSCSPRASSTTTSITWPSRPPRPSPSSRSC